MPRAVRQVKWAKQNKPATLFQCCCSGVSPAKSGLDWAGGAAARGDGPSSRNGHKQPHAERG
jgi:hypothetical protein